MEAITANKLAFSGGDFSLHPISFQIPSGCVYGLLGPSRSGKTMLIRLLNGLVAPTAGQCSVLGINPAQDPLRVHAACGVMTDGAGLYRAMTGMQNLVFFGKMFGMEEKEAARRANQLLKDLEVWEERDRPFGSCPTGVQRRMELARAMMNQPQVLFLDEPGRDLDPEAMQALNALVASISQDSGVTVFLCTHNLAFAQAVCDTFGILLHGRMAASGTLEELCSEMDCRVKARLRLRGEQDPLSGFKQLEGWYQTDLSSQEEMPGLLHGLMEDGKEIYEARLVRPTLRDAYLACMKREGEVAV